MELYDISFNGIQLNNGDFSSVMWHDFDQMPDAKATISPVSTSNFSVISSKLYVQKTATVTLLARHCTNKISAKIAMIRKSLQGRSGILTLDKYMPELNSGDYAYDQWTTLTYPKATLDTVEFDTSGTNTVATATFTILTPIGIGGDDQTFYSGTAITSTPTSVDLTITDIQGTFNTQYPIYTIEFNSVTNGSNPSISITNAYNTITYSGFVAANDVLVFDTTLENMSVTLNGTQVDFTGTFPTVSLNGSALTISDTYSARNIDISIVNSPRFI